jgi:hypothetical protein
MQGSLTGSCALRHVIHPLHKVLIVTILVKGGSCWEPSIIVGWIQRVLRALAAESTKQFCELFRHVRYIYYTQYCTHWLYLAGNACSSCAGECSKGNCAMLARKNETKLQHRRERRSWDGVSQNDCCLTPVKNSDRGRCVSRAILYRQ